MFGLTFEKLLLVAIIGGVLIGPQRLPHYAHQLSRTLRSFRDVIEAARAQTEREMGVPLRPAEWDLAQYDPRRIVREAMQDPARPPTTAGDEAHAARIEEARRVRPGQKFLVTGSTAHPRRVLIESLPADDPRRIAARLDPADASTEACGQASGGSVGVSGVVSSVES